MAHELGHFKKNHVMKTMLSFFMMSFIGFALLGWAAQNVTFYYAHGIFLPSNYTALILFSLILRSTHSFLRPSQRGSHEEMSLKLMLLLTKIVMLKR